MKQIIRYEHKCKRCLKTFVSKTKTPIACGKCKSAYWNLPRAEQKQSAA